MSTNSTREARLARTNSGVALNPHCYDSSSVRHLPKRGPYARLETGQETKFVERGTTEGGGGGGGASSGSGSGSGSARTERGHKTRDLEWDKADERLTNQHFQQQPQRQSLAKEEEEEEEEQEQEEEEEEEEEEEGEGDLFESSKDNDGNLDGFLDDFARELDGSEDETEEEEGKGDRDQGGVEDGERKGQGATGMQDGDEQVACALQEEEWRRNPPLSTRASCSRPFPRGRCSERYLGDIICSGSGSGSIFDVANAIPGKSDGRNTSHAGRSNGGGGSSTSSSGANNAARADAFNAEWRVHDADPDGCPDDYRDDGGSLFTPSTSPLKATKRGRETNGSSSSNGNTLGWRKGRMAAAGEQGRERGEGRTRTGRPAAWPPGGLSDGEGLPFNDLPDEIVDKIACFASLPRCVSKRVERYRVKVFRERVIAALESSAKLPPPKAKEVEDAIFGLCGCSVTKAYKAKAREMSFNLRVGKNDPLRERLLSGSLLPSELVRMTSNELAPLSVRRERERLARKRIQEVTSSRDSPFHTVTDRFSCLECGFEKTQYRTWRRKAVVDRVRVIVQCLQCRHSWEL